jgi:hypothetical protein
VDNVIDFMAFKEARDEVIAQDEEMETEIMREDILEFLMNSADYTPGTFTFTVEEGDE